MLSTPRAETITLSGVTGTVPPNDQHGQPPVEDHTNTWHPQGATYLNPIAPPIAPHQLRRPWPAWVVALIGLVSVGLLGVFAFVGAALSDPEPDRTVVVASPTPSAPTSRRDSAGQAACDAVKAAIAGGNRPD